MTIHFYFLNAICFDQRFSAEAAKSCFKSCIFERTNHIQIVTLFDKRWNLDALLQVLSTQMIS